MEDQNRYELEMDLSQINQNERLSGSWFCCLPCYWLKRNSGLHKMFLSVITLLVTVLLVASPVLFLISSIPGEKLRDCGQQGGECRERGSDVCLTAECSKAGNQILGSMSWKANPCKNFYQFACGSWKKKPKMLDSKQEDHLINFVTLQQQVDQNIQNLLMAADSDDLFQELGTFYKSCIRVERKPTSLLPMLTLLEELGGYVTPEEDPPEDLTDLVLSLMRLNGAPLFDIYLDSDLDNSSELAPFIDLPPDLGFNLDFEHRRHHSQFCFHAPNYLSEAFPNDEKAVNGSNSINRFLKTSIEDNRFLVMENILEDFMPRNLSFQKKINETQITLHFANIITKLSQRKRGKVMYYQGESKVKMAVEELERKFPFIRWQHLLGKLFKIKISPHDQVFLLSPDYLENLQKTLYKFPFRVIHNGLLLIFATDTLYGLVNASAFPDWTTFCNRMTVNTFGKAVSVLYVRQYREEYVEELKTRVALIFNTLKSTFEKRIKNISWLDARTRSAALHKLSALRIEILSSPIYWNATYASSLMTDIRIHPTDFFGNVIQRYRHLRNVSDDFKRDRTEEKRWAYPFAVNAFYVLTSNTIFLPLPLLTQPCLRKEFPLYVPYSTLGLILAHEILHGFDLKGIGYDSEGNFGVFMSQDSREKFEARLDCFVKQFSSSFWWKVNFLKSNDDLQFDWNMTKNEIMADIGGLQMAYQAWKSATEPEKEAFLPGVSLNPHQLFFLNAAQTYCAMLSPANYIFLMKVDFHTPQLERVNGIMMNSPEFGKAYNCSFNTPMNPRKKCSSW